MTATEKGAASVALATIIRLNAEQADIDKSDQSAQIERILAVGQAVSEYCQLSYKDGKLAAGRNFPSMRELSETLLKGNREHNAAERMSWPWTSKDQLSRCARSFHHYASAGAAQRALVRFENDAFKTTGKHVGNGKSLSDRLTAVFATPAAPRGSKATTTQAPDGAPADGGDRAPSESTPTGASSARERVKAAVALILTDHNVTMLDDDELKSLVARLNRELSDRKAEASAPPAQQTAA